MRRVPFKYVILKKCWLGILSVDSTFLKVLKQHFKNAYVVFFEMLIHCEMCWHCIVKVLTYCFKMHTYSIGKFYQIWICLVASRLHIPKYKTTKCIAILKHNRTTFVQLLTFIYKSNILCIFRTNSTPSSVRFLNFSCGFESWTLKINALIKHNRMYYILFENA